MDPEARRAEAEARSLERQRVLEAAGLIIKPNVEGSTPRPPRRHRPAPKVPDRSSKALPDIPPEDDHDTAADAVPMHLDDAYDRYQAFRQKQLDSSQRLSVVTNSSLESAPMPTSPTSTLSSVNLQAPSMSAANSATESRASGFLNHILGRRTPGPERKTLTISAPTISQPISSDISRENSPAFGTSWSSLVTKDVLEGIPDVERKRQEVR